MPTLNWIGKEAVVNHDKEVPFKLLKKIRAKSEGQSSRNLLIHGDNLEALKAIMPYYYNKVNCVYIDPPYNTGNEKWKYNDNVNSPKIKKWLGKVVGTQLEDLCRHDKWLCMMYPRLNLLRDLLADDGTLFISINEEELCNLKFICDEIFGENNYLTLFTVKVRHENRILKGDKDFHETVEYLLLYRKSKKYKTVKRILDNSSNEEYVYEVKELNKNPEKIKLGSKNVWVFKPGEYKILKNKPDKKRLKKINIRGSIKEGNSSGRFYMKYLADKKDQAGYLYKVENIGSDGLGYRYFLIPSSKKKVNGDYFQGVPRDRESAKELPFPNYLDFEKQFNNVGYEGGVDFREGKKPIEFLIHLFVIGGVKRNEEAIILDSFAGSGSTGHAVLELNKRDNGKRKFILIQLDEDLKKPITMEGKRISKVIDISEYRLKNAIKEGNYRDGFEFCELDKPLFDKDGQVDASCSFEQLARYIYFTETQTNLDKKQILGNSIGEYAGASYYLIFKEKGKNVFNKAFLNKIKKEKGKKVVYADKCLISEDELEKQNIEFKQIPYEVKVY